MERQIELGEVADPSRPKCLAAVCDIPPPGWRCTRAAGHEGPCAAVPTTINCLLGPNCCPDRDLCDAQGKCQPWIESPAAQSASGFAISNFPTIDNLSPPGAWAEHFDRMPKLTEPTETERWWAKRWLEKSTPGEIAAMREALAVVDGKAA